MNAPFTAEVAKLLSRLALGWFLLHQGWGKVVQDVAGGPGTFYQSGFFQNNLPDWLPTFVAAPYAYALPWLELVYCINYRQNPQDFTVSLEGFVYREAGWRGR